MRRDDAPKVIAEMAFKSSYIECVRFQNLRAMALNNRVPRTPLISYQNRLTRYYKSCAHQLNVLIDKEKNNKWSNFRS